MMMIMVRRRKRMVVIVGYVLVSFLFEFYWVEVEIFIGFFFEGVFFFGVFIGLRL